MGIFEYERISGSRIPVDVSRWVHPLAPLQVQGQAMVAHYVEKLLSLPRDTRLLLQDCFAPADHPATDRQGCVWNIVGHCLGLSSTKAFRVWKEKDHWENQFQWNPVVPGDASNCGRSSQCDEEPAKVQDAGQQMIRNAAREAIAKAVEGQSYVAYERQMTRYLMANAQVGKRLGSARVAQEFVNLGGLVMQMLDAQDFHTKLPGIGVPSHYGVSFDGVPIGVGKMTSHDELLVVCMFIISSQNFLPYSPMLAAPAMPFDAKTGDGMLRLVSNTLANHPAKLNIHVNAERGSGVGGDGGVTEGGPSHRHQTNRAAELLWHQWHPEENAPNCTTWDRFHQSDLGMWRAVNRVPIIMEIFDVGKRVQNTFGFGRGAVLLKSVGAMGPTEDQPKSVAVAGGTRKTGHMAAVTANQIHNLPTIMKGLWARIEWIQRPGTRGSTYSLQELMHLSGRLTDVSYITGVLILDGILDIIIQPFSRKVQEPLSASEMKACQQVLIIF